MAIVARAQVRSIEDYDQARIQALVKKLAELRTDLCILFPEREHVIDQMLLALLMRVHVLMYGEHGTGKSHLNDTLLVAISQFGDRVFRMVWGRSTDMNQIVGPIDPVAYRETGEYRRIKEAGMLRALYAEWDEILDGLIETLRETMDILYGGFYRRGTDVDKVDTHVVFASTNVNPFDKLKDEKKLAALLDRFPLIAKVTWLEDDGSIDDMINHGLDGNTTNVRIDHEDLIYASDLVIHAKDQWDDRTLVPQARRVFRAIRTVWTDAGLIRFSDRTFQLWTRAMEAHAVVHGNLHVTAANLNVLRLLVCDGTPEQLELYDTNIGPLIQQIQEERDLQDADVVENALLDRIEQSLPSVPPDSSNGDLLLDVRASFARAQNDLAQANPTLTTTIARLEAVRRQVKDGLMRIDLLIEGHQPQ